MEDFLFSGLKVIDCATVIAAPAAAMILGDYGADVIKIEQPGEGDMLRMLSHIPLTPTVEDGLGDDWFWQLDGRNKRSLVIDLKTDAGRGVLDRLVADCDVFITNQPLDVRESLGLGYDRLRTLNARMIYASLSAYGEAGPERARKGFDQLAYWARSGLMDLMREPGTMPTQGLPGMGDHPTGVALYAGIVTALLQRERTGEGGLVQTSLLANGLWSAAGIASGAVAGGDVPLYRQYNTTYAALLRPYRTADGRWLQMNMVRNEDLFALMLAAMDAIELLSDDRFCDPALLWVNRGELGAELQRIISTKHSDEWLRLFAEYEVPVNRIALVEEVRTDPQVEANDLILHAPEAEGPPVIAHPLQISSVPQVGYQRAPALGEHSAAVLAELGYTPTQIEELLALFG